MTFVINGRTYSGSPEEIVEQIRQGWAWTPLPTTEEIFRIASELIKEPIKTAEEYIKAMVKLGVGKIVEEEVHAN